MGRLRISGASEPGLGAGPPMRMGALDVPIRIYVYERDDGTTVVSYYRPSPMFVAYNKPGLQELSQELDNVLRPIVHVATK